LFSPIVDENRIVYDWLQTAGKLHQKSGGTPKKRSRAASSSVPTPTVEPVTPAPSATPSMAKTFRDYSTPAIANVPIGPTVNFWEENFELCTGLIMMV
jgi:hypothetical protein